MKRDVVRSVFALLLFACTGANTFVWVDDLNAADLLPEPDRIEGGDRISVLVWNQERLSGEFAVRGDGNVTLPLLGDVAVAGLTPAGTGQQIERRLAADALVVNPKVTVSLVSLRPPLVSVLGEVRTPGLFEIRRGEGVLQALSRAGGLTPYADTDAIFVVRQRPERQRIRFSFQSLAHAGNGTTFILRDGDVVIVE
jgi:polysaccharide biosynthesis/export protein